MKEEQQRELELEKENLRRLKEIESQNELDRLKKIREEHERELQAEKDRLRKQIEQDAKIEQERLMKIKEDQEKEMREEKERVRLQIEENEKRLASARRNHQEELDKLKMQALEIQKEKERMEKEKEIELERYKKELEQKKKEELENTRIKIEEELKQAKNLNNNVNKNGNTKDSTINDFNPNGNAVFDIEIEDGFEFEKKPLQNLEKVEKKTKNVVRGGKHNYYESEAVQLVETQENNHEDEKKISKPIIDIKDTPKKEVKVTNDIKEIKILQKQDSIEEEKPNPEKKESLMSALEQKAKLQQEMKKKEDEYNSKKPSINLNNDENHPDKSKEVVIKPVNNKTEDDYFNVIYGNKFQTAFVEKVYSYKRRREGYSKNKYFSHYIMGEYNLVDKYKQITRRYYKIQEEQYNSSIKELKNFNEIFDFYLKNNNHEKYIKELLEINANPYNSRISNLQDLEYISKEVYRFNNNSISDSSKFNLLRTSTSDGDSFYRMFMFALFEKYIITENSKEIKKLILDIYKIIQDKSAEYKNKEHEKFYLIIYYCLKFLEEGKVQESHKVLLAGFNAPDGCFDMILNYYIRSVSLLIYEDFNNEVEKNDPTTKKRVGPVRNSNEVDDFNLNLLTNPKNEACKYALQLAPFIFNVNINVFALEGYLDNKDGKNISVTKHTFNAMPNEDNSNIQTINMMYNFNKYDLLYFKDDVINLKDEKIYSPFVYVLNMKMCNRCKNTENFICIPFYGISFCQGCALGFMSIIISNRISFMNKENYHSIEYYGKPIEIVSGCPIGDILYCNIFGENMKHTIYKKFKILCFNCDQVKKSDEIITLNTCQCNYCKPCLETIITKATNKLVVLNNVEKEHLNKFKCCCNDVFNIDEALTVLNIDLTEYKIAARKRYETFVNTLCMKCLNCHRNDNYLDESGKELVILKQKDNTIEKDIDPIFDPHIICLDCIEKVKQERNDDKTKTELKIRCNLCFCDHFVNEENWNAVFNQSACDCVII